MINEEDILEMKYFVIQIQMVLDRGLGDRRKNCSPSNNSIYFYQYFLYYIHVIIQPSIEELSCVFRFLSVFFFLLLLALLFAIVKV